MKFILSLSAFILITNSIFSQTIIPLYKTVPNSNQVTVQEISETAKDGILRVSKVTVPTITSYFPDPQLSNGTSVIICPGGGYGVLSYDKEGIAIAKEFNKNGVAAFVLKYRLPDSLLQPNKEIAPLQDVQQAFKIVRSKAKEWNLDENKVGVVGFSAGGHLASTAGTHYKNVVIQNPDNINLRPDFLILCYPVISFADSLMHKGSRNNLLGLHPSVEKIKEYSNELQVNKETPPTFLIHAGDDKTVKVANSILFYEALQKNGVTAELHIFPKGGHGFGLSRTLIKDGWFDRCITWMASNKWINQKN